MLNVAPQKERIPDHLRAMAEQDDKSAASGKTGEQSSIGVGCAPGEERDSAISICAVHSTTVTAAIAEFCEDTVEKQKTLTEVLDGLVDLTTRLASLATARRSAIVAGVVVTATENLGKALAQLGGTRFTQSQFVAIAEDDETSVGVNDQQSLRIVEYLLSRAPRTASGCVLRIRKSQGGSPARGRGQ